MSRPPHAVLLKVGLQFTRLGGVLAPITDTGPLDERREFEYIPFPEWPNKKRATGKSESELMKYGVRLWTYGELLGINHPSSHLSDYLPHDKIQAHGESWVSPEDVVPHNDPNFRHATSGEYWRSGDGGRLPRDWRHADLKKEELWIFFKQALAPFTGRSNFYAMSSQQHRRYGFYIIGQMLVKEFVDIGDEGWESAIERHPENRSAIVENFHFRRTKDSPLIVVGDPKKTRLYKRAIPLKAVADDRTVITEAGRLVGVKGPKDQVRFKYIYDPNIVDKLLDMNP